VSKVNMNDADVERFGLGHDGKPMLFEVVLREGDQAFFDEIVPRLAHGMDVFLAVFHGPAAISALERAFVKAAMDAFENLGRGAALGLIDVGTTMWRPGTKGVGFFLTNYAVGARGVVHFTGRGPGVPALLLPSAALAVRKEMISDGSLEVWFSARVHRTLPEVEAVRETAENEGGA